MTPVKAVAALLILIITNAFVFGGILWNRSGEPTGRMVFDQCELNSFKSWSGPMKAARYASLNFESQKVDEVALKNLYGFDSDTQKDKKWFARRLFVVLKHGGAEWREFVEPREQRGSFGLYGRADSKLVLVDGDTVPERLREKYPESEGLAILPGYVASKYWRGHDSKGYHWDSASRRVAIGSQYREIAKAIRDARIKLEKDANKNSREYVNPPCSPTHRITVIWGQRFEPWISSIEAL